MPTHPDDSRASETSVQKNNAWLRAVGKADRLLAIVTEVPAALLVLAEILVLLGGVVSRYVLHHPLTWSDELASMLFLWLAMLGSVIALRRSSHMRMTALVDMTSPDTRAFLDLLALVAAVAFLAFIGHPAYEFAAEEAAVTSPSLEISNAWRASALPVGIALMCFSAVLKLAEVTDWRRLLAGLALATAVVGGLYMLSPLFQDLGNFNLLIFFVGIVALLVLSGVPIAFAFGLATLGYIALTTSKPTTVIIGRMDEGMSHIVLLSVPLFVFLGIVLELTGMAKAMVKFLASLLGHVRGGMSFVLVGGMYLVSGISGSKAADMAAIAPVLFPEMRKRGVKDGEMVALLAATGAQTETIPPSIVLITIGSVTGISISALFAGGLVPALVLAIMLCAVIWWRHRKDNLAGIERASWPAIRRTLLIASPALALPFIIRATVVEGVATATEVSTIGIAYALIAGAVIYRQLDYRKLWPALVDTAALSGAILLIIGTATGMAWALTQSGFSRQLAEAMSQLPGGATGFLAVSILAFIILGSVLEGIPAIVVFGPLLFPIAKQFGINDVHYSMVVVLSMGIGLFAPPFGVGYYAACAISRVSPSAGMRPIVGYIIALIIGTILVAAVPELSTGFFK
ncbi:TRAP transporter large permease subunit [Actimicrobium sp. CCC2.4]|uniref:TRAP transporter large permease n=1 Tax=Actimicrobium sp. CCC2.4 TaxID=3048606 RepID=UPI002AC8B4B9|nr:TRAP transporter large permease subunit [Actimicrobium sp. CCC2.4]MEB0134625.1 TRAP transporter large permease subunit [Actimicrobium sp. CCC2.4]WPX30567.1 TRAP transporter large permease subunit [Actimicrobium sp. CCC2.4]